MLPNRNRCIVFRLLFRGPSIYRSLRPRCDCALHKETPHFGSDELLSSSLRMICIEDMLVGHDIPNRVWMIGWARMIYDKLNGQELRTFRLLVPSQNSVTPCTLVASNRDRVPMDDRGSNNGIDENYVRSRPKSRK